MEMIGDFLDHQVDDLADLIAVKLGEDDDFVDAVQEFWSEHLFQDRVHAAFQRDIAFRAKPKGIGSTASLTPAEFAAAKNEAVGAKKAEDDDASEATHVPDNPKTAYANPGTTTAPIPTSGTNMPPGIKTFGPKQPAFTATNDTEERDAGLLGMGALLGTVFVTYGATEGLPSQYVVAAGGLTLYCLTRSLGLKL